MYEGKGDEIGVEMRGGAGRGVSLSHLTTAEAKSAKEPSMWKPRVNEVGRFFETNL